MTDDGRNYAKYKYKELVRECCFIARSIHTPYSDVLAMTPVERGYILGFLAEERKRTEDLIKSRELKENT